MIPAKKTTARLHENRTVGVIAREAANFIAREASDESLITVIRAVSLAHGERANVFVSVFPEEKSRAALAFLERQRAAFSDYLKEHTLLSPLPHIDFLLDNREHLGGPSGN